jgi:hypothetical protein
MGAAALPHDVEGLMAGSNHMVSLLLVTAVFLSLKHGRDGAAGVFLGIQLFKPQLAIATLVVLVARRRWRAVLGFAAVAAIWMLASTLLVGSRSLVDYLDAIPGLTRLALAEGFPFYLQSSLYALFMIPLGPALLPVSIALGTLASLAVLGLLLRLWSGPWRPESADFDLRFAATVVATALVSQHFLVHDMTIAILAVVLLANRWTRQPVREGWGTARLAAAALWVACFAGPILTQRFRVPIVPFAALFLGWSIQVAAAAEQRQGAALAG